MNNLLQENLKEIWLGRSARKNQWNGNLRWNFCSYFKAWIETMSQMVGLEFYHELCGNGGLTSNKSISVDGCGKILCTNLMYFIFFAITLILNYLKRVFLNNAEKKKNFKKWETVEKFRRAQVEVVNLLECKLNLMKVLW